MRLGIVEAKASRDESRTCIRACFEGQANSEHGTAFVRLLTASYPDRVSMPCDDFLANPETQSSSAKLLSRKEGLEETLGCLSRHAVAGVTDRDYQIFVAANTRCFPRSDNLAPNQRPWSVRRWPDLISLVNFPHCLVPGLSPSP